MNKNLMREIEALAKLAEQTLQTIQRTNELARDYLCDTNYYYRDRAEEVGDVRSPELCGKRSFE